MYAKTILLGFSFLEIAACGASPSNATAQSQNSTVLPLTAQAAQIQFPSVNGLTGSASYSLTAPPPGGTNLTISATTDPTTVPAPLGLNATVLVAYLVTSTQSVQLSTLPAWQITAPSTKVLSPPYGVEAFDGQSYVSSYAASNTGSTVSANSFGPAFTIASGHTYIFEIVQNPILNQLPH